MKDSTTRPRAVTVFATVARLVMPKAYWQLVGRDHVNTFRDKYGAARSKNLRSVVFRFWWSEILGLFRAAAREHRDELWRHRHSRSTYDRDHSSKEVGQVIGSLRKDFAYAVRMMIRTPVISAIAILSLGIGVSVNTSIFSVLHSFMLRPLPYENPDQLVLLHEIDRNDPTDPDPVSPANFFAWKEQTSSFADMVASRFELANLTGLDRPEQLTISAVTPNFFQLLGTEALRGRTFLPGDGGPDAPDVAVVSETLWRNRFGADPAITNRSLTLGGTTFAIVGVVPERFDFVMGTVQAWIASDFFDLKDDRSSRALTVTARLRDGVTLTAARADLDAAANRLEDLFPQTNRAIGAYIEIVRQSFPGPTDRGIINILMTVVFLVLLVACANIANLLMAKTDARQGEIALRAALGAGRHRIVRQLLTESVLMALIGGSLGMLLSVVGVRVIAGALPAEVPGFFAPTVSGPVVAFGFLVSLLAGLAFGVAPATQAARGDLKSALFEGGRGGSASRSRKRLRQLFVVSEFGIAVAVLVGAAVLTDVFKRRLNVDPGFDADDLLTLEIALPQHRYGDADSILRYENELLRSLPNLSGVTGVALSNVLPRTRNIPTSRFSLDGESLEPSQMPQATWLTVNPDYFATMGIAVSSGRPFTVGDRSDGTPVVMVNQRMVDLYFAGENPVGSQITIDGATRTIVGVAADIAQMRLSGLVAHAPSVYFPSTQRPVRRFRVILRTAGDPLNVTRAVQNAIWAIDADQPITAVRTMQEHIVLELAVLNVIARILFVVGLLALSLAAMGIYAVMAFSVSQQTSEIGIRMALGAKRSSVLYHISRQGAMIAGLGLCLGVPLSVAVILAISGVVRSIGDTQALTVGPIGVVAGILAVVVLAASYLPARRATRIDPIAALQRD